MLGQLPFSCGFGLESTEIRQQQQLEYGEISSNYAIQRQIHQVDNLSINVLIMDQ